MNEPTRRGLLTGAVLLLGASAGCQSFDPREPRDSTRSAEGSSNLTERVSNGRELYVADLSDELPEDPSPSSFAVTGEGIFRYDQSDAEWLPIRYGSLSDPVPEIVTQSQALDESPTGRPLFSSGSQVVYVDPEAGDDSASGAEDAPLATVQEAVQRVPVYLSHQYEVDLAAAPDLPVSYDEDVLVPAIVGTGHAGREKGAPRPGPFANLVLRGQPDDASAVDVGSLMFGNVLGAAAGNFYHATISRDSPYDDEDFGLSAYGGGEVKCFNIDITSGPTNGVLAYGARMKATRIDWGQENVDLGLKAKRHASVILHDSTGVLMGDACRATGNSMISVREENSLEGRPQFNTLRGGLIYDGASDSWEGISSSASSEPENSRQAGARQTVPTYPEHPDDTSAGDLWYIDGSGNTPAGFYGQRETGPTRIG